MQLARRIETAPAQPRASKRKPASGGRSLTKAARFASGTGNMMFLGSGAAGFNDRRHGRQRSLRIADAALTSSLITEGLKHVVRAERPDGSARTSFPSGHSTAAFAVATMQSHYKPSQAPLWYTGAALIGASRVKLKRHYLRDVVAGAAVGHLVAKAQLRQERGLLLRPFISGRDRSPRPQAAGLLRVNKKF